MKGYWAPTNTINHSSGFQRLGVKLRRAVLVGQAIREIIEVEVFVGILPASQNTYMEATRSQKKEDF